MSEPTTPFHNRNAEEREMKTARSPQEQSRLPRAYRRQ